MSVVRDVIDALVEHLEMLPDLPDHEIVKYGRPAAILPEDCPLLVVWYSGKAYTPQTTHWLEQTLVVSVSWHWETVERAQDLRDNPEAQLDALAAMETIERRVQELSREGLGPQSAWEILPAAVRPEEPEMEQALTQGLVLDCQVRVTE